MTQTAYPNRVHAYAASPILRTALAFIGLCSAAHAEPTLWLAQSKTAKVYLFGTMHILPKKAEWLTGKIATAFAASTVLMEEADVGLTDPSSLQGIMGQAMSPDTDIWAKLSPAAATKFRAEVQKCGLPDEVVGHFKPWFASMLPAICALLSAGSGEITVASRSPEAALIEHAKQRHLTMDFFETPAQQVAYLASATEAVQIKELESAIEDSDNIGDAFTTMESAWLAGDVSAIAHDVATMRAQGADFYNMILTQRNVRFATRIAQALKGSQTVFVAIGAGHLAGPDSVQAQLGKLKIATTKE